MDNTHVVAVGSDTVDLVAVEVVGLAVSMMVVQIVAQIVTQIGFRLELVAAEPVLVFQMDRLDVVDLKLADLDLGLAVFPVLAHLAQQQLGTELAVAFVAEMLVVPDANTNNQFNLVSPKKKVPKTRITYRWMLWRMLRWLLRWRLSWLLILRWGCSL